jgi:hypothetical protein
VSPPDFDDALALWQDKFNEAVQRATAPLHPPLEGEKRLGPD